MKRDGATGMFKSLTWRPVLRGVKKKWDPQNLFRLNQNIPPA